MNLIKSQIEKVCGDLELKTRRTMFGPQKDDFQIFLTSEKKISI